MEGVVKTILKYDETPLLPSMQILSVLNKKFMESPSSKIYDKRILYEFFEYIGFFRCKENAKMLLNWAAREGHLNVVKYLFASSPCLLKERWYFRPLLESVKGNHFEVVKYLAKYGGESYLYCHEILDAAVNNNNLEIVKYLVEHGTEVHVNYPEILVAAVNNNNLEIVKYLVEHGANPRDFSEMALRCASLNQHLDIVEYLIEKRAAVVNHKSQALNWVASRGKLHAVKILVEAGEYCEQALVKAASRGHLDTVKYLIAVDPRYAAKQEEALLAATERGQLEMVKYLIGSCAYSYSFLLNLAKENKRHAIVKYLKSICGKSKK